MKSSNTEMKEVLVHVSRVTKVVKGGKNMSFQAIVVVGGNGWVGYGTGKAREVADATKKASISARKKMVKVPLRESRTLHHDVIGKFGASSVVLRSAPAGTGIIAGGPVRTILGLLGVQDVVGKSLKSTNPHNIIKATFDALVKLQNSSPKLIAEKRNKKVSEVVQLRESASGSGA